MVEMPSRPPIRQTITVLPERKSGISREPKRFTTITLDRLEMFTCEFYLLDTRIHPIVWASCKPSGYGRENQA